MQQNLPSEEGKKDLDPKQKTDRIVELGSSVVTNHHGTIHCLTIIGQIEGHTNAPDNAKTTKYEHLLPLLASLEESDDVDGVLILLNTVGGDVEAGLAIAEMIAGMTKPTATLVLGGGHSIGIPLAVSGRINMIAPSLAWSRIYCSSRSASRYFQSAVSTLHIMIGTSTRAAVSSFMAP